MVAYLVEREKHKDALIEDGNGMAHVTCLCLSLSTLIGLDGDKFTHLRNFPFW